MLATGADLTARFAARERFNVWLFTIFGAVALVLAAIGLYGVLAFLVTQRTHEIGIRLALGGQPKHVLRDVIGEGLTLTAAGLTFGLGGGFLLGHAMKDLLFQVEPTDPFTHGAIAVTLIAAGLSAALGPARRAATARIAPGEVLRH
jgi:putative ABC transport system permease protein